MGLNLDCQDCCLNQNCTCATARGGEEACSRDFAEVPDCLVAAIAVIRADCKPGSLYLAQAQESEFLVRRLE